MAIKKKWFDQNQRKKEGKGDGGVLERGEERVVQMWGFFGLKGGGGRKGTKWGLFVSSWRTGTYF